MKQPPDATIAREKLTHYLLVPQTRGDKSAFLNRAGYSIEIANRLLHDLRFQLLPINAAPLHETKFGRFYEIRGALTGPSGVTLCVRAIWMKSICLGRRSSLL